MSVINNPYYVCICHPFVLEKKSLDLHLLLWLIHTPRLNGSYWDLDIIHVIFLACIFHKIPFNVCRLHVCPFVCVNLAPNGERSTMNFRPLTCQFQLVDFFFLSYVVCNPILSWVKTIQCEEGMVWMFDQITLFNFPKLSRDGWMILS